MRAPALTGHRRLQQSPIPGEAAPLSPALALKLKGDPKRLAGLAADSGSLCAAGLGRSAPSSLSLSITAFADVLLAGVALSEAGVAPFICFGFVRDSWQVQQGAELACG